MEGLTLVKNKEELRALKLRIRNEDMIDVSSSMPNKYPCMAFVKQAVNHWAALGFIYSEDIKGLIDISNLKQTFENNSNCYADTTDQSVVLAMDADKFVEVVRKIVHSI